MLAARELAPRGPPPENFQALGVVVHVVIRGTEPARNRSNARARSRQSISNPSNTVSVDEPASSAGLSTANRAPPRKPPPSTNTIVRGESDSQCAAQSFNMSWIEDVATTHETVD